MTTVRAREYLWPGTMAIICRPEERGKIFVEPSQGYIQILQQWKQLYKKQEVMVTKLVFFSIIWLIKYFSLRLCYKKIFIYYDISLNLGLTFPKRNHNKSTYKSLSTYLQLVSFSLLSYLFLLLFGPKTRCEIEPRVTRVFGQIVIYVRAKGKLHKYWNIISIFIGAAPMPEQWDTRKASEEIESMNLVRPSAEITFMIKKILKPGPKIHPSQATTPKGHCRKRGQDNGAGYLIS